MTTYMVLDRFVGDNEDEIFVAALTVEETMADEPEVVARTLQHAGRRITELRGGRKDWTLAELAERYDGPPPVPLDTVRAEHGPDADVSRSMYVERVAGHTRVVPVTTVAFSDGGVREIRPTKTRRRGRGVT